MAAVDDALDMYPPDDGSVVHASGEQALALADGLRCILACLRDEPAFFRSDSSVAHFEMMTGLLGQVAGGQIIAAAGARGMDRDAAREYAIARTDTWLAQIEAELVGAGVPIPGSPFWEEGPT
jgi:hypothetical protein